MSDNPQDAATLRARLNHHAATKAAAETERARLVADRAEAGALLSDADLDEVDQDIARLGYVIERAGSRVELIRPALVAAEAREAEAEALSRRAADNAAFATVHNGTMAALGSSPEKTRSAAVAALQARGPEIRYSSTLFDLPPPQVEVRVDLEQWHKEREERLRAEAASAPSVPRPALTSADFGRPNTRDPLFV